MAQPSAEQVHVDAVLSNISVAYMQKADAFIASKIFPVVNVSKQSDLYYKYTKGDWFRDEAAVRGDTDESVGSGYNLSTDSYQAKVWAFHKDVGRQTMANYDNPLNAERDAAQFVTQRLMLRQEIQWAADYFTTGKWGTDYAPAAADQWDTYATSEPAAQLEDAKEAILSVTGHEANALVVGYQVHKALKNHPDVLERNKYTSADSITPAMIARWLEIDNYYVAKAIKNTAQEGATDAYSFVQGKNALLCHVASAPSLLTPTAGYTMRWAGVSDGLGTDIAIKRIPMPLKDNAVRVEGQIAYDNKLVAADMGYFFSAVVS